MPSRTPPVASLLLLVAVAGCGRAYVRTPPAATDLPRYRSVVLESVTVTSVEQHPAALRDNEEIAAYARQELLDALRRDGRYRVLDSPQEADAETLRLEVVSNVRYGSRALRYLVGFGAGSGRVESTLTGRGEPGGQEKLRAVSESDLAVGAFGGSMKKVVRKNIRALLRQSALLHAADD